LLILRATYVLSIIYKQKEAMDEVETTLIHLIIMKKFEFILK